MLHCLEAKCLASARAGQVRSGQVWSARLDSGGKRKGLGKNVPFYLSNLLKFSGLSTAQVEHDAAARARHIIA